MNIVYVLTDQILQNFVDKRNGSTYCCDRDRRKLIGVRARGKQFARNFVSHAFLTSSPLLRWTLCIEKVIVDYIQEKTNEIVALEKNDNEIERNYYTFEFYVNKGKERIPK